MLIPSTTVSSFSFRVFFVNSHISPIMCHICFSSSFRPSHPPRVLSSFPNDSRSNSFAYKFPNFHPLFFRPIGWKFQGSNLYISFSFLSPSPSLSLSLSPSLTSNSMEISRFEFPNFHPCFIFTLSLFSLDRMEVPRFESAYKSPTSLSPFSLPLSLPARLDENSKIRIHPNFQISKFPSPSFSFHSIGRTLAQAWSAYESLSSSSLLLSRPLRSVRTYFPPPVAPSPRLRPDSKVATRPGDPSAATRRALAELWTSGSEKARSPSRFR